MDITTVFGTVVPGSNPGGSTNKMFTFDFCSHRITLVRDSSGFERKTGTQEFIIKIGLKYFYNELLVGFSRGRGFECFMNNEVMKWNTKVVTEYPGGNRLFTAISYFSYIIPNFNNDNYKKPKK